MAPYAPGRQPAPGTKVIKLNTNENPYPPSPRGLEVLGQIDGERLRRYPHPRAAEFQRAVADVLNIDPNWVLPANGSDDLLTILMRATAGPGRVVVYPSPTYVLYRTLAAIQDAPVVEVPFDDDYALPVQELLAAQGTLTIVANPNSPSGTAASVDELAELATTLEGLLVVDEAYVAFADRDALELTKDHDNVVILRTLSKSHGLAGLMVGMDFTSFVLNADGSGVARLQGAPGRLASAAVSMGGLIGPAVGATGLFMTATRPQLARLGLLRVGPVWHQVKRAHAHAQVNIVPVGTNASHNLTQDSCAIFNASSVTPRPSMCAKEFVQQISVAMLDIHKVRPSIASNPGSSNKIAHQVRHLIIS